MELLNLVGQVHFMEILTLYIVLGVFMGSQMTGGYEITITDLIGNREEIRVYYSEKHPDVNEIVIQELTQPYHFIRTSITTRYFTFLKK